MIANHRASEVTCNAALKVRRSKNPSAMYLHLSPARPQDFFIPLTVETEFYLSHSLPHCNVFQRPLALLQTGNAQRTVRYIWWTFRFKSHSTYILL